MAVITRVINSKEYMLFEGGYTKERAKKRSQQLQGMLRGKKCGDGSSARTVSYEGQYAVFIKLNPMR